MNDKLRFGEILARAGVLEREALEQALKAIGDDPVDLGEVLVSRGVIDEKVMLKTISKALNLPSISLEKATPDTRAIELVPLEMCTLYCLIPIEVERGRGGEHLHLAMANPSDVKAIKKVTRQTRLRIRPMVASAREIRASIQRHYGGGSEASSRVEAPFSAPGVNPNAPTAMPAIAPDIAHTMAMSGRGAPPPPAGSDTRQPSVGAGSSAGPDPVFDFGVTDLSQYDTGSGPAVGSPGFPRMTPNPRGAPSRPVTPGQGSAYGRELQGALATPAPVSSGEHRRGSQARDSVGVYVKVSRRRTGPRPRVQVPDVAEPARPPAPPAPPAPVRAQPAQPAASAPLPPLPPGLSAGAAAGIARSRAASGDPFKSRRPETAGLPPIVSTPPSKPKQGIRRTGPIQSPRASARARLSGQIKASKSGPLEHLPTPPGLGELPPPSGSNVRLSGPLPDPLGLLGDLVEGPGTPPSRDAEASADAMMMRYLERFDRSGQSVDAVAFFSDMERMLANSDALTTRLLVALIGQLGRRGAVDLQALLVEARGR